MTNHPFRGSTTLARIVRHDVTLNGVQNVWTKSPFTRRCVRRDSPCPSTLLRLPYLRKAKQPGRPNVEWHRNKSSLPLATSALETTEPKLISTTPHGPWPDDFELERIIVPKLRSEIGFSQRNLEQRYVVLFQVHHPLVDILSKVDLSSQCNFRATQCIHAQTR